jgi:hypothetical protein
VSLLGHTLVFVFAIGMSGMVRAENAITTGSSNGIPYASGGIGLDSRDALLAREGNYNLMVILSLEDGHYLGGAALTVRDQAGKTALKVDAKGPWVFAKLPPGSYTVEATARDITRKRQVLIGKKKELKRAHLTWP